MARSKSSKLWMQEHVNDPYVKQAKKEGLRSRAAFKIKEIQEKHKLIKPGMMVLELGAAPGSWTMLLKQWVGAKGKVYALDLLPIDPISGVELLQGDIQDPLLLAELSHRMAGQKADVVLSDIAPNLTGNSSVDTARASALWYIVLEVAEDFLKADGAFCIKAFQGAGFEAFVATLRKKFAKVQIYKPKASRSRSSEIYLVAQHMREASQTSTSEVAS